MRDRQSQGFRPGLERLEAKRPLAAGASTAPMAHLTARQPAEASSPAAREATGTPSAADGGTVAARAVKPNVGFLVHRITQTNHFNSTMLPPFSGHVLVQAAQPVPGQVYNVLYVVVRNGTAQTFDASSGFSVGFPGAPHFFPILTGDEQWKPGQRIVFYVLTKKYYPLANQEVSNGFVFDLGGGKSVAIPGPSGIFLRLKYDPARINRQLDGIVAFGQGAQGGVGPRFGMPDTAIYEFLSAKTRANDFGGLF
jgi:hypothetical protein